MPDAQPAITFDLKEIFTFFFLMLGPIKILGPYAKLSAKYTSSERGSLALRGAAIATLTILAASFIGQNILVKWKVSLGALAIAGGILFFLVAISTVLAPYTEHHPADGTAQPPPPAQVLFRQLVPMIVSPYGISAVIFVLTLMPGSTWPIVGILLLIMVLDLAAMLLARKILAIIAFPLQVVGTVMGVLQVALAVQMIILGTRLVAVQKFGLHTSG